MTLLFKDLQTGESFRFKRATFMEPIPPVCVKTSRVGYRYAGDDLAYYAVVTEEVERASGETVWKF